MIIQIWRLDVIPLSGWVYHDMLVLPCPKDYLANLSKSCHLGGGVQVFGLASQILAANQECQTYYCSVPP